MSNFSPRRAPCPLVRTNEAGCVSGRRIFISYLAWGPPRQTHFFLQRPRGVIRREGNGNGQCIDSQCSFGQNACTRGRRRDGTHYYPQECGGWAGGGRERELDGWARKRSRATERGRRIVWTLLEGRRRVRSNSIVIQSLLLFVLSNPP